MGENGKKDLLVTQKAKELCDYVFLISERMPKKTRFTLTVRLQNLALDVISHIYTANEVFIRHDRDRERIEERMYYQRKAGTSLKLVGYVAHIALRQNAILPKQFEKLSQMIYVCGNILGGWIQSDVSRLRAIVRKIRGYGSSALDRGKAAPPSAQRHQRCISHSQMYIVGTVCQRTIAAFLVRPIQAGE